MTREVTFAGRPESVELARRFAESALHGVSAPAAIDIVLMVSELASNAVVHTATAFRLSIERTDELIRVEVRDESTVLPRIGHPSKDELHGRGLQLVEALSDQWGTRSVAGTGKLVWFVRTLVGPEAERREGRSPTAPGSAQGAAGGRRARWQRGGPGPEERPSARFLAVLTL